MSIIIKALKSNRGSIIIEGPIFFIIVIMCLALFISVSPAFIAKQQLDVYASELKRTAELTGKIGEETAEMERKLTDRTGIKPEVTWSKSGKIQLGDEFVVTCYIQKDIGFGGFGPVLVPLSSREIGRSEVYWK